MFTKLRRSYKDSKWPQDEVLSWSRNGLRGSEQKVRKISGFLNSKRKVFLMIMIYDLQQSYTGRQLTVQQTQGSATYQDGGSWGPWAVFIGPGRGGGGTLQHAQHSGPQLLRGGWELVRGSYAAQSHTPPPAMTVLAPQETGRPCSGLYTPLSRGPRGNALAIGQG